MIIGCFLLFNFDSYSYNIILSSNEFNSGVFLWVVGAAGEAAAASSIDNTSQLSGVNSGRVKVKASAGNHWHVNFYQNNIAIQAGKVYKASFMAPATIDYASCFQPNGERWGTAAVARIQHISPSISGNVNVCMGNNTPTLLVSGALTDLWSTGATSAAITESPSVTTTCTVALPDRGSSAKASATVDTALAWCYGQVSSGDIVKYDFSEVAGSVVNDISGNGILPNLTIQNPAHATWVAGCGLRINTSTKISSSDQATKIRTALRATNAMTVEAWLLSANTVQNESVRIDSLCQMMSAATTCIIYLNKLKNAFI